MKKKRSSTERMNELLSSLNANDLAMNDIIHREESKTIQQGLMKLWLELKDALGCQDSSDTFGKLVILQALACMLSDEQVREYRAVINEYRAVIKQKETFRSN